MSKEHLIPEAHKLTVAEQSAGGKRSGEVRAAKRDLRKALEILLDKDIKSKDGTELSGAEAIALKLFEKALKGDIEAFKTVRDTAGQKPIDKVMIAEVEQDVIDEVERIVNDSF